MTNEKANIPLQINENGSPVRFEMGNENNPISLQVDRVKTIPMYINNIVVDTTENWRTKLDYVPKNGEIVVYSDRDTINEGGIIKNVSGIKVGDGNAYVVDLPFIDAKISQQLLNHINNNIIHITNEERNSWNKKIDVRLDGERLEFTRL